ncbi:MAG: glycosidase, partial [Syntrophaceticus schinkii]|nr:glycosidase [Syntrophaceticus schinkii]
MGILDSETLFEKSIAGPLEKARRYEGVNLVVGIPFYNEVDTLPLVLKVVEDGLVSMKATDKAIIICAGDPAGKEALEAIKDKKLQVPHMEFLMLEGANGRGMSIRALLELADRLEADLAILAADIIGKGSGLQPGSIQRMLKPLQYGYDLVLTSFRRQYFEDLLGKLFLGPLLETFFGYRISDAISGTYAISHDMVEEYCTAIKFWVDQTRGFGIDPWLITTAIIQQRRICEVPLGFRMEYASLDKVSYVFKDFAEYMFESIRREEEFWKEKRVVLRSPDIYGLEPHQDVPAAQTYDTRALIHFFRNGFNQYRDLLATACPQELFTALERSVTSPTRDFHLDGRTWANTVYSLLSHYSFAPDAKKEDVLEALTAVFCGRMAGFLEHLEALQEELASEKSTYAAAILSSRAESKKDEQRRFFLHGSLNFIRRWKEKSWKHKPPLIPADYLEFIPGKPIVLPKCIKWRGGQDVWTAGLFNRLQTRYSEKFHDFLENNLLISADSNSRAIASRLEETMEALEETMDHLSPGNVYTEEGTRQAVEGIFQLLGYPRIFGIKEEIFEEALMRFPPLNIMIPKGCHTPRELLCKMLPRDAVTVANLIETRKWADRTLLWILDNLDPEDMEEVELKPLILGDSFMEGTFKLGKISD